MGMYGATALCHPGMDVTNHGMLLLSLTLIITLPTPTSGGWVKKYRRRPSANSLSGRSSYGDSSSFTDNFDDFESRFKSGGYDLADLKFGSDFHQGMSYDNEALGTSSYGFGDTKYGTNTGFGKSFNYNYSPGGTSATHYDMGQGYGPESSPSSSSGTGGFGQSYGSAGGSYGATVGAYGTGYGKVGGSAQQSSFGRGTVSGGSSSSTGSGSGALTGGSYGSAKTFDQSNYKTSQGYHGEGPSTSSRSSAPLSSSYKHYVPQQPSSFDDFGYAGHSQPNEPYY